MHLMRFSTLHLMRFSGETSSGAHDALSTAVSRIRKLHEVHTVHIGKFTMAEFQQLQELLLQGAFLYEDLHRFRFVSDDFTFTILNTRVSEYKLLLCAIYVEFNHIESVRNLIPELIVAFENQIGNIICSNNERQEYRQQNLPATQETLRNGAVGRPRLVVAKENIEDLRTLGFSWSKIAAMLGLSRSTLLHRRNEFNISKYTEISDSDLDRLVSSILSQAPRSGESLMIGSIRSRGLKVKRERIRDSIMRVDPIGRLLRRRQCIKRRTYNVAGPNYLWLVLILIFNLSGFEVNFL